MASICMIKLKLSELQKLDIEAQKIKAKELKES